MSAFTIKNKIIAPPTIDGVIKWCVDFPKNDEPIDSDNIESNGIELSGWFLSEIGEDIQLVALEGSRVTPIELNIERHDVIEVVLNECSTGHPLLTCGFKTILDVSSQFFQIGFIRKGHFNTLIEFELKGALEIIEGHGNWLFLDNDTNNSVEQFTGKLKLSRQERAEWKKYFRTLLDLQETYGFHVCMLIAPSKEMVFPQHYPFERGKSTAIDQVLNLVPEKLDVIFPVRVLQESEKRSYRMCDTHWSHFGSMKASVEVASHQKTDISELLELFNNDHYRTKHVTGDLGNKIYPNRKHDEEFLASFNHQKYVVFDNKLPNFGRMRVIYYDNAIYDEVLLILGSSSSYTLFNYLCRIYKIVVFVHCAGNIDISFVEAISPDYVLTQSNARFIIRPPSVDENYFTYIEEKLENRDSAFPSSPLLNQELFTTSQNEKLTGIIKFITQNNQNSSDKIYKKIIT